MTDKLRQIARVVGSPLLGLALVGLLVAVARLPDLSPPSPPQISESELAAERKRRTIDTGQIKKGRTEVPVIRLLDHLKTAQRKHPKLAYAYRKLAHAKGAPGHWRHYIDPWSRLPPALRPLRVQMNFAFQNVRAYARPAGGAASPRSRRGPKRQFGRDRSMNKTPGVNEQRLCLFAPPPASFTFQIVIEKGAALTFGSGVPANGTRGPVTFTVEVAEGKGEPITVASFTVKQADRHQWHDRRVDLSAFQDKQVQLTLRSQGPKGAFAFWSNPVIWRPGSARPGKNIVFILVDTLRADGIKSVAGKHPVSPHMDALAARGVTFTQCYSMATWTRSSLLGMFTGEHVTRFHPSLNTSFKLNRWFRKQMYARWPRMLTWHLREKGYWVEAIVNNFFLPSYTPIGFDRGFDKITDIRAHVWDTPAITRGAIRFLRAHKDRPFFLYLHYDGPHQPYWAPKGYRVRGARPPGGPHDRVFEKYLGEVRWTDDHLGPVFAELKRLGLDGNTIVVLTGDHGEVFHSAHDIILGEKNRTLHHHGWSNYQEVTHVPLIITGPGLRAGQRIADVVSHIDLPPTFLELAGLPPMQGSMGRSWLPAILKGKPLPGRPIASVARWSHALRKGKWKYIYRYGGGRSFHRPHQPERRLYVVDELYDLTVDPHETRNLARRHPKLVRTLRKELTSILLGRRGEKATPTTTQGDAFAGQGLRLSLRLSGGSGKHRLKGNLSCKGTVVVRSLSGPTSHAAYDGKGKVAVLLQNEHGKPAEMELTFQGCAPSTIRLDLRLNDKPLKASQVIVGPVGLHLMPDPARLPLASLPAFVCHRPPPRLPSTSPRVHLWLGSSYAGDLDLDGGSGSSAARLADKMLRDAGYSKGPSPGDGRRPAPMQRPTPR